MCANYSHRSNPARVRRLCWNIAPDRSNSASGPGADGRIRIMCSLPESEHPLNRGTWSARTPRLSGWPDCPESEFTIYGIPPKPCYSPGRSPALGNGTSRSQSDRNHHEHLFAGCAGTSEGCGESDGRDFEANRPRCYQRCYQTRFWHHQLTYNVFVFMVSRAGLEPATI
jgi:hypothetical protein